MTRLRFAAAAVSVFLLPCLALSFTIPQSARTHYGGGVRCTTSASAASAATDDGTSTSLLTPYPAMHWTVPGFKVGWQDDEGKWFDEDGPRNGPPLNYWRQAADEKEYAKNMRAVDAVLSDAPDLEEVVVALEQRNSARKPTLSRKLLGSWAPLAHRGARVAERGGDTEVRTPFRIDLYRTHGRRFAPKIVYGIFDRKLSVGEELTVATTTTLSTIIAAEEANEPRVLGTVDFGGDVGASSLELGRVTFLSDYLLIQRNTEGAIDLWLRADDAYQGVSEEDAERLTREAESDSK